MTTSVRGLSAWALAIAVLAVLVSPGCYRARSVTSLEAIAPAGLKGQQPGDLGQLLKLVEHVYEGDPESRVLEWVREPDRWLYGLGALRRFRPPANCYAGLWQVGALDVYLLFDRDTRRLKDMIFVERSQSKGARRVYEAVRDDNRSLVSQGMSEPQVRVLFGAPAGRIRRRWPILYDPKLFRGRKTQSAYGLRYNLEGSRDDGILIIFSKKERRVLGVDSIIYW